MKTFTQYLESRDPQLYQSILEEGVLDYLKQKVRDVRDFHAGILTSFLSTMKQTFGEFGEDAKKVMQAYRDGKLKPKQIEEISAALNEKDERGNKRPNWGKVFATLAKLGIFLVTALSVSGHGHAPTHWAGDQADHAHDQLAKTDQLAKADAQAKDDQQAKGDDWKQSLLMHHLNAKEKAAKSEPYVPAGKDTMSKFGFEDISAKTDWNRKHHETDYTIDYDDILNNVHKAIEKFADDSGDESLANKTREQLVPGKDFKVFEVIPSKFIPAMSGFPSQFHKSLADLKGQPKPDVPFYMRDRDVDSPSSAQSAKELESPKLIVFINTAGATKNAVGFEGKKVSFGGVATQFKTYAYDKDKKKYDGEARTKKLYGQLKGMPMFSSKQVVIPYPGDLRSLDLAKLDQSQLRTLFHELRHTTQEGRYEGDHVLGTLSDIAKKPDGSPMKSYLGTDTEFGVRVAAFKDLMDPQHLKDVFSSSLKTAAEESKVDPREASKLERELSQLFDRWSTQDDVDKMVDLLDVHAFGKKMGYEPRPELDEDEIQAALKSGKTDLDDGTPRQRFIREALEDFVQQLYKQDFQIEELLQIMNHPHAQPIGGSLNSSFTLDGKNQAQNLLRGLDMENKKMQADIQKYRDMMKKYLKSNWKYIVKKGDKNADARA